MVVKTITLDLEAYELLKRRKQAGQSFSQVIKAQFGGREPRTAGRLLAGIAEAALSAGALDETIALSERRQPRAR